MIGIFINHCIKTIMAVDLSHTSFFKTGFMPQIAIFSPRAKNIGILSLQFFSRGKENLAPGKILSIAFQSFSTVVKELKKCGGQDSEHYCKRKSAIGPTLQSGLIRISIFLSIFAGLLATSVIDYRVHAKLEYGVGPNRHKSITTTGKRSKMSDGTRISKPFRANSSGTVSPLEKRISDIYLQIRYNDEFFFSVPIPGMGGFREFIATISIISFSQIVLNCQLIIQGVTLYVCVSRLSNLNLL